MELSNLSNISTDRKEELPIGEFIKEHKFEIKHYSQMDHPSMAELLCFDMYTYLNRVYKSNLRFFTFIATFNHPIESEEHFQDLLQKLLENLHLVDRRQFVWDKTETGALCNTGYCFSLGGKLFYLTTLHPQNSNTEKRYLKPMIVFSPLENILGGLTARA